MRRQAKLPISESDARKKSNYLLHCCFIISVGFLRIKVGTNVGFGILEWIIEPFVS
jgi:hypothetical protein